LCSCGFFLALFLIGASEPRYESRVYCFGADTSLADADVFGAILSGRFRVMCHHTRVTWRREKGGKRRYIGTKMRDVECLPIGYKHLFMTDALIDDDRVGKQDGEHVDEIVCMLLGYQITAKEVADDGFPPV
jgi:hypothetical protein